MREHRGDLLPGLSVPGEGMLRAKDLELVGLALELGNLLVLGDRLRHGLAVQFCQPRLIVECFQVGGSTRHAQDNDPLAAWWQNRKIAAARALCPQ